MVNATGVEVSDVGGVNEVSDVGGGGGEGMR